MALTRPHEVMNVISTGQESLASLALHLGVTHAPPQRAPTSQSPYDTDWWQRSFS